MSKELKIMLGVAMVVLGIGALLFIKTPQRQQPGTPTDSQSLVRDLSHMTGKKDAKVTVVEFGDYQCPFCAQVNPTVKQVIQTYQNNPGFNFVFRNFPLPQHQYALLAAEAAEAAGALGKFWAMNNLIYERQNDWVGSANPLDLFVSYAQSLDLDVNKFKNYVQNNIFSDVIQSDKNDGDNLGVNATPTFFINGQKQDAAPTLDEFKQKIDALLK